MLLADVVSASMAVASTRSRLAKVAVLAGLLSQLTETEVAPAVAFLAGLPRQGKVGAGWRTLFGIAAAAVASPTLSIVEVDNVLTVIAGIEGKGAAQRRTESLEALMSRATAPEQDFLRRLLTGELRQGALEGVMIDAVAAAFAVPAEAVRRAFLLSGQLTTAAVAAASGGAAALAEFRLVVGRPVRPMLATPAESLDSALAELGRVTVEYKLDGARIQVHRMGADVRVYTRTLREITAAVPELVGQVRGLACESVVLDGETLALTDDGRPRPFQETMSRFGARGVGQLLLRPYFFDCLHLDGQDLLDLPLEQRIAALDRVAGRFRIPGVMEPGHEEAMEVALAAAAAGHEGVVIKSLESSYAAGRRGRSWQKVKPVHTLDLIVLAAEWGHGRRRGLLSNLHLGARDPDGGPAIMVGKTFKGLTDELLRWQTAALADIALPVDGTTEGCSPETGVVRVRPELVVEIELDGVQVSPRYPGGVALRFARVLRYRPDKEVNDADTIDQVRALLSG
ncbi:MAG: ATP-dependent DNA ligase [Kutzneria sp.]|nr:ATP-dependent DNA ligase [Kutzneria sp.]MBV9844545.1 ATP-dependent DNA ligase [Kutzneria sp.]